MKVAVMQPYFLPYLGYFHLMDAVDEFVVYDNIRFTKRGWFHRNRILVDGEDQLFTIPLKQASDHLDVEQRELADNFENEARRILRRIEGAYRTAPYYGDAMPIVEECFKRGSGNLFEFIRTSLELMCKELGIGTRLTVSSTIDIDHRLRAQNKVLAICGAVGADQYVNAIGGKSLYEPEAFDERGVRLLFVESELVEYFQFGGAFVPRLSILDVLMFNSRERVAEHLKRYSLT